MEIFWFLIALLSIAVVLYFANRKVHDTLNGWWSKIRRGDKIGGPE